MEVTDESSWKVRHLHEEVATNSSRVLLQLPVVEEERGDSGGGQDIPEIGEREMEKGGGRVKKGDG